MIFSLVGVTGFEPAASWSRTKRTTKLCHTPDFIPVYYTSFLLVCQVPSFTFLRKIKNSPPLLDKGGVILYNTRKSDGGDEMRHCQAYSIWSDPETVAAPGHHGMSYALIRIDRELGRVIGARCPEPTLLKVGDVLDGALDISPDSIATYTKNARTAPPLFVRLRSRLL